MINIKVLFLNKEYIISDQLKSFVPIMYKFDKYTDKLLNNLMKQVDNQEYTGGNEKDFVFWSKPIEDIAKSIVIDSSKNGIFDLTVADLLNRNSGYIKLRDVCNQTIKGIANILTESFDDWIKGYNDAYSQAASNITGSGVSIWTSSLGSALLYSAMESSVLKKQAKKADSILNEKIHNLNISTTSAQEKNILRIKTEVYYPGCRDAIEETISYMLGVYISKLSENNIIDYNELKRYDLSKSYEVLNNISIIQQKEDVLCKAFEICPYNLDIYKLLIDDFLLSYNEICDEESVINIIKEVKMDLYIEDWLSERIGLIPKDWNVKKYIERNEKLIDLCIKIIGMNKKDYLNKIVSERIQYIKSFYLELKDKISDDEGFNNFSRTFARTTYNKDYLADEIKRYVKRIDDEEFNYIVSDCNCFDLCEYIAPEGYTGENRKILIDEYYIKKIYDICKPKVDVFLAEREREKEEKNKKQDKMQLDKKRKIGLYIFVIVLLIVLFFGILNGVILQ